MKIKICNIDNVTLNQESVNNLNNAKIDFVSGNKAQVITINYKSYFWAFLNMIYFSIVTITTTGFGDIYPSSIWGKLVTALEILIGQFFIIIAIGKAFTNDNVKMKN